VIKWNIYML